LRSFAYSSSSLSMIVGATQICKRTYHRHRTSDLPFGLNSFHSKSIVSRLRNLNFCVVLVTWMEVSEDGLLLEIVDSPKWAPQHWCFGLSESKLGQQFFI
jgi:hypothetical protein